MRAVSGPERTLLASGAFNIHMRVLVANGSDTLVDLSALLGQDWILNVNIAESIDTPTATLTFSVIAGQPPHVLHPLHGGSGANIDDTLAYAPLLHPGRRVEVEEAITAMGAAPVTWRKVFQGTIDKVDSQENGYAVSVEARDKSAVLIDTIISLERQFSTSAGMPVETIIQQLADTYYLQGGVLLVTPVSPGWMIRKYTQARVPLFEAMRALAQQIGWDIRYRWNASGVSELQFYEPDRAKVVPDDTLPPAEYLTVESLSLGRESIRNHVKVIYKDAVSGNLGEVEVEDLASIAIFGRRYLEVKESAASNIDSASEATAMANAILSDLSQLLADQAVTSFSLWFYELHDLLSFPTNSVHYDSTQAMAIVGIQRTWENGSGRITLQTRGKPAGAYRAWILKHGDGLGDGNQVPAVQFGTPIGEDSEGGGVSGDGMVWLDVQFEPKTKFVKIFAEEGDDATVAVPDITEITTAWTLYRQEGDVGEDPFWHTMVGMATRPFRFKRLRCIGYNKDGEAGPEWVMDAVQAVDTVVAIDGEITAMSVAPGLPNENVVTVNVGNIDPNEDSWLFIMRNGIVLARLYLGVVSGQLRTFTDSGINSNTTYTYEVFVWTGGLSGVHWLENGPVSGPPTPPGGSPSVQPHFINGTPYLDVGFVQLDWDSALPWFWEMFIETSPDGVIWTDLTSFNLPTGSTTDPDTSHKWYRLRAEDSTATFVAYSAAVWFGGQGPPGAQPPSIVFTNNTPDLVALGSGQLRVKISWAVQNAPAWYDHVNIEASADGITWGVIHTDPNPADDFYDLNIGASWYRLIGLDAGEAQRFVSAPKYWAGVTQPPGGFPPTTPPDFTMVAYFDNYGRGKIQIDWTCPNSSAITVGIEASNDDGGLDPWTEIYESANVAFGQWRGGIIGADMYFRMTAKNAAGTIIATSASQLWPGDIYYT